MVQGGASVMALPSTRPPRQSRWSSEVSMQNLWQTGKLIIHFQDIIAEETMSDESNPRPRHEEDGSEVRPVRQLQ